MSDLDAILATVLDRPEDDIPRLVYADKVGGERRASERGEGGVYPRAVRT